jgi:hypothetical protein
MVYTFAAPVFCAHGATEDAPSGAFDTEASSNRRGRHFMGIPRHLGVKGEGPARAGAGVFDALRRPPSPSPDREELAR